MGQQFISQSFSSPASPALSQAQSYGTRPTTPLSLPAARTQPEPQQTRKGGNKDGIWPDDDEWWNQQEVVYEAFIDAPANNRTANPANPAPREPQDAESSDALEQRLRDRLDAIEREDVLQETTASIQPVEAPSVPTPVANNIAAPVFPERFKITEEELAGVVLDWAPSTSSNMEISDSDSDCGSDFELAWDDDEEENVEMDTETPPPSTPVQSSLSLTSLPVPTVTPKKYIATPTTPFATGRRPSFARIKGYSAPVHSPRTELVM